ncbi:hypothetical protein JCM5350_000844 [Sporobolomyces pararoseus]
MAHELRVEGDKVIESDAQGHVVAQKNYSHVHAGYVAATHNPRVSDEAKHNAETILHDLEAAHGDTPSKQAHDAQDSGHNTRSHDHPPAQSHASTTETGTKVDHSEEVHRHRNSLPLQSLITYGGVDDLWQIGGYKSTLHRDDTSEEAKAHARDALKELGVDPKDF